MNKKNTAILLIAMLLSACQNNLFYVSHATVGIDVTGNSSGPSQIIIGLKTIDYATVPPRSDGSSNSILGELDVDLNASPIKGNKIHQRFASGDAAICAAGGTCTPADTKTTPTVINAKLIKAKSCEESKRWLWILNKVRCYADKYLIAASRTEFGFSAGYGEAEAVNTHLGYKRRFATSVPTNNVEGKVPSIYEDSTVNSLLSAKLCQDEMAAYKAKISDESDYQKKKGLYDAGFKKANQSQDPEIKKKEIEALEKIKPIKPSEPTCSPNGGARFIQTLATGNAAKIIAMAKGDTLVKRAIKKAEAASKAIVQTTAN